MTQEAFDHMFRILNQYLYSISFVCLSAFTFIIVMFMSKAEDITYMPALLNIVVSVPICKAFRHQDDSAGNFNIRHQIFRH